MEDIVYFSFNNWFSGRDYPNDLKYDVLVNCGRLSDKEWAKENKLVIVTGYIDMSINWCIAAPKKWVEENLPELLNDKEYTYQLIGYYKGEETIETYTKKYSDFVYPCDENGEAPSECKYGMPFKEYDEDEIGIHWVEEDEFDWEEDDDEKDEE